MQFMLLCCIMKIEELNIAVLDSAGKYDYSSFSKQCKEHGYNLVALFKEPEYFINFKTNIDILIAIIEEENYGSVISDILLLNTYIKWAVIISKKYIKRQDIGYFPTNTVNNDIFKAIEMALSSNNTNLDLSYQNHKFCTKMLLSTLGFSFSHKGTKYLTMCSYLNLLTGSTKLYQDIYKQVAKYYNTTVEATERNIRSSISSAAKYLKNISLKDVANNISKAYNNMPLIEAEIKPLIEAIIKSKNKGVIVALNKLLWQHIL